MTPSFLIPDGCKPSVACEPSRVRPLLSHGYLRKRTDGMWLLTADSYIAVALRVTTDPGLKEGWVPVDVLRKMETREASRGNLLFTQVDFRTWNVRTSDDSVVTTYKIPSVEPESEFPNIELVGDGLLFDESPRLGSTVEAFGFNPEFLGRIGKALGGPVRVEVTEPLKPIRLMAIDRPERRAIQMPIRLIEERHGKLRAAA